jgi:hypothetical protein
MGKTFLKYGFITIGIYLGAVYATGAGRLLDSASAGTASVVKAFQGR